MTSDGMAQMFDTLTIRNPFTPDECNTAQQMNKSPFNVLCYMFQLIFCIVSLGAVIFLFLSAEIRRTSALLSKNLKMLAFVACLIYLSGVLTTTVFYTVLIVSSVRRLEPCEYIWASSFKCLIYRTVIHYSIVGVSIIHLLLLAERLHSLRMFGDRRSLLGVLFASLAFILPVLAVIYMYREEEVSGASKLYCFAARQSIDKIVAVTNITGVLDIFALFGDIFVLKFNEKLLKKKTQNYSLSKAFQLREREISMKLIIPLSVVHTVLFLPFVFTYLFNQRFEGEERVEFLEFTFLIKSFYNMVLPLSIVYLNSKRQERTEVEWLHTNTNQRTEAHFQELNRQLQQFMF